jgi:Ca2+-binding EF-hand superfamily protein
MHQWNFLFSRFNFSIAIRLCLGAALGCHPVWCRPLDTPDYLMPYYLLDTRSRFSHYASIRSKKGRRYMTIEDFVCALLASKDPKLEASATEDLRALFAAADANGDGRISFTEFNFLMTLLTVPLRDFERAFVVFDEDGTSSLTFDQFSTAILAFSDESSERHLERLRSCGFVVKLFGADCSRRARFSELKCLIEQISAEIWSAEFYQYDTTRSGWISSERFGQLIAAQLLGSHLPFFLADNLRKLQGDKGSIPLSMWISFHKIMTYAEDIGEAIAVYTSSGLPLRKKDFMNAITAYGLPELSSTEVNLVYALFDRNGDGALEYDEFLSIMKSKLTFHAKAKPRDKFSLFQRLSTCGAELIASC